MGDIEPIDVYYSVGGSNIPSTLYDPGESRGIEILGATRQDGTPVNLSPDDENLAYETISEIEGDLSEDPYLEW